MYDISISGHMTEPELKIIESWSQSVPKNGVIVELGSHQGRSAYCWSKSCDPSVKIYCIDKFENKKIPNIYENFKRNTKDCDNIIVLKGVSPKNINYPGDSIDIFFMDAAHTNPNDIQNFNHFRKFFKKSFMLCGHDYHKSFPDVIENVKYFSSLYNKEVQLYQGTSLWSIKV